MVTVKDLETMYEDFFTYHRKTFKLDYDVMLKIRINGEDILVPMKNGFEIGYKDGVPVVTIE